MDGITPPVTVAQRETESRLERYAAGFFCLMLLIAFGFLSLMSLTQTCVFDESVGVAFEEILFRIDFIPLNLLVTGGFFALLLCLRRFYGVFAKLDLRVMEIALGVWAGLLGVVWVLAVTSIPDSDSMSIFEAATKAANGDFSPLYNGSDSFNRDFYGGHSYFNFYPFQLGFVLLSEMLYRLFGTDSSLPVQLLNAVCLGFGYFALARITGLLFKKKSTELAAIVLLAGCFQPMLMCSFAYGNIIGMSAAVWAALLLIKYFQTARYRRLIGAAALLAVSVIIKYNNMIYLAAFVLMLVIHAVKHKKWQSIALALAMCVMCVGGVRLVVMSYELRAGTKLESGLSQLMYLDLGLQESSMCSGWFNKAAITDYEEGGYDTAKGSAVAMEHIGERLRVFTVNPPYFFRFFVNKYLSQWNETSYESIWVSQVKLHIREIPAAVRSIYDGAAGKALMAYFDFYMQILFLLFTFGIFSLFYRRRANIETYLLPLVVLGAVGYHLLFEAKSQYALTYIPLLIPTAAYMVRQIAVADLSEIKNKFRKMKNKPSEETEQGSPS